MKNKLIFLFFIFIYQNPLFSTENPFNRDTSLVISRSTLLDMNGCNIGDEGAKKLAIALRNNSIITQAHFHSNKIGDEGIKYLAETFETLPNLNHLYLYDNRIGNNGAIKLFLSLKNVKSLRTLDIRNNTFNSDVMPLLADLLKSNEKLNLYTSFVNFNDML